MLRSIARPVGLTTNAARFLRTCLNGLGRFFSFTKQPTKTVSSQPLWWNSFQRFSRQAPRRRPVVFAVCPTHSNGQVFGYATGAPANGQTGWRLRDISRLTY